MYFTKRELEILKDQEFLQAKVNIIKKINELLTATAEDLKEVLDKCNLPFPTRSNFISSKISKGENYRGFPYLVLDYPAIFSKDNIFAFRTMFWWGNFFSATLHLQGESFRYYHDKILEKVNSLSYKQIYISVGNSPWQYHYEKNNYILVENAEIRDISNKPFIKFSRKLDLDSWKELPGFSVVFFNQMVEFLV